MANLSWMDDAECVKLRANPDIFTESQNKDPNGFKFTPEQRVEAEWYCNRCKVTKQCEDFGGGRSFGIFGGKFTTANRAFENNRKKKEKEDEKDSSFGNGDGA